MTVEQNTTATRRYWPRLVLTLPPDAADALAVLARDNYRDKRREALRILVDGIARETKRRPEGTR